MNRKRTSILSDLERNYDDTKSISKSVDLSALENKVNPHQLYNKIFKDVDNTPQDFPTEKISVGDVVYINNQPNKQFEVISINDKSNITLKNLSDNSVVNATQKDIKKIMENIDMAKKLNETQYSVSINGLETTDANALSQMMSAAAQADSGNADVGGLDMTSTPELPTPENTIETLPQDEEISSITDVDSFSTPETGDAVISSDSLDSEDSIEEPSDDMEMDIDEPLSTDMENPLNNPEPEMDSFEDDFDMGSDMDMDEPVVDDIEFDEEITPSEDELDEDTKQLDEYNTNLDKVNPRVLQELYDVIIEVHGPEFLADDNEVDYEEVVDAVKDFGNEIEGFDPKYAYEYAYKLKEKCSEEYCCPNCGLIWDHNECENCGYNPSEDDDEELDEDILLPKATEDETFNASKKLKDEDDEESERISESMDALIKSILENADGKSAQETYAKEITESDEEILDEEDGDSFDAEISEALRNAGVQLDEATVKPTIVTDESSFANKPNKALKPEDEKTVEKKTVDTSTFGADASEGFKEPLNCIKCEAVSPKEKIKAIYETAKVRYSKANKDEWNALDRRYIKKLIENGCGYTRASKIILEAKKQK